MLPQKLKYRLWKLAMRMNPRPATYFARTFSTVPGGTDGLLSYNLLRVTSDIPTIEELSLVGASLADSADVFYIYQVDLEQAIAPVPQIGFELGFSDGKNWVIHAVRAEAMQMAYRCVCSQARPQ